MQKEKVRVYALARELGVDSKDLLEMCRQAGLDVKNQLSSLDPEQRDMVELLVKRGGVAVAEAPLPPKSVVAELERRGVRPESVKTAAGAERRVEVWVR